MSEGNELVLSRSRERRVRSRALSEDFNRAMQLPSEALERLGVTMLGALATRASLTAATLDQWHQGVLLVDASARVLLTNRQANALLGEQDGLAVADGALSLPRTAQLRFSALLAEADVPRALRVVRPSGRADYLLKLMPIESDGLAAGRSILVIVDDPLAEPPRDLTVLVDLYELTPAQCRLTHALLRGHLLTECAAEMAVSLATVKAHLRELFSKTGTNRQADLIRLFSRVLMFAS